MCIAIETALAHEDTQGVNCRRRHNSDDDEPPASRGQNRLVQRQFRLRTCHQQNVGGLVRCAADRRGKLRIWPGDRPQTDECPSDISAKTAALQRDQIPSARASAIVGKRQSERFDRSFGWRGHDDEPFTFTRRANLSGNVLVQQSR